MTGFLSQAALLWRLRRLPSVQGVYLTVEDNPTHYVVVDPPHPPLPGLQVVPRDEIGDVFDAHLLYLQRAGRLRTLFERAELRGPHPNGVLWLAEACWQIRRTVEAVRAHEDDLPFWKARLTALQELLVATGGNPDLPSFPTRREAGLEALIELVLRLDAPYGQLGLMPPNVPLWKPAPHIHEVTHEMLRHPGPWRTRIGGFQLSLADPEAPPLPSWTPPSLVGFGEPLLVTSRFQRQGGPLWAWTLAEAQRTVSLLRPAPNPDVFLAIATLLALPGVMRSRLELIVKLAAWYPYAEPFLTELVNYLRAREEGRGLAAAQALPTNFGGYMTDFSRHMLGKGPPPENLHGPHRVTFVVESRARTG